MGRSSGAVVICPACGGVIRANGMGSHRRGLRCTVDATIKRRRAAGFDRLDREWEPVLRAANVPIELDYTRYIAGNAHRGAQAIVGCYIPEAIADHFATLGDTFWNVRPNLVLAGARLVPWQLAEREHDPVNIAVAMNDLAAWAFFTLLKIGNVNEECRQACRVIAKLTDNGNDEMAAAMVMTAVDWWRMK